MKKYIILFVALALSAQLTAQESTLLHFMRHSPQSLRSNPANLSDTTRFYMGIPFIMSNLNFGFNSGFAYSDAFTRGSDDSLHINRDILNTANDRNRLNMDFSYELLSFGIRFREDNMITFSLSAKAFGSALIPKDIVSLLLEGNPPGSTFEAEADVNATAYVEAALGYSRRINDSWKVGGRVKYLAGMANAYGKDMKASMHTDENTYAMTLKSDALVYTSFLDMEDGVFANSGMGFDLGVYYKSPIEGLEVSLSMIDWGWISWNSNVSSYRSSVINGEYQFAGLASLDDSFTAAIDTLSESFKFEENDTEGQSYMSTLPGKIFLGASYDLTQNDKFGFLFSTRALHNFQRTTFGLMYSRQVGNWLTVAVGNNFMMNKLFNPSLALLLGRKGFQFHIAAENISSFNLKDVRAFNFQIGMSIAPWAK